ncbi:MAG: thioesterase domain-containing protein, partial [Arenicella sp.]
PMTINGKLDRNALPAPVHKKQHADFSLSLADACEVLSIRPRTGLEMQLLSVWADVTGVENCGITDDFFDLGGHSMTVMKLVDSIHKRLQKTVPMATVFQCPTVEKMADWMVSEGQNQDAILLPFSPVLSKHEQNQPIFAYPPLTGMPLCYYELSVALNTVGNTVEQRQPFYGLQAPGINDNAKPLNSIELMAQRYLEELTRVSPQGPYRLMGWSLGGMVAFETARMLVDAGYVVEQLVLVDAAPFSAFEQDVSDLLADPIGFTADTLAIELPEHLSNQQKMPFMLKQAVALKVLPSWFDLEALQRLSAVIIASMTAYIDYEPGLYTGQMTLVKASASPEWDDVCPQKVWSTYCQQVNLIEVPQGTHDNLLQAPQLDYVVRSIND